MATLNKTILIGRLGKDVEISKNKNGVTIARFSLATSKKWRDKNNQPQEKTEWHNIRAVGKKADVCAKYLAKGSLVYIEGESSSGTYQDESGAQKSFYEIFAKEIVFLPSGNVKSASAEAAETEKNNGNDEETVF